MTFSYFDETRDNGTGDGNIEYGSLYPPGRVVVKHRVDKNGRYRRDGYTEMVLKFAYFSLVTVMKRDLSF